MAIPSSGAVSLSDIQTEFGGSNPISMSEYYAGGSNVPPGTTGDSGAIPTSGEISIGDFYGSSNRVAITLTISSNTNGYNIYTNRGGTYQAGISDVTLVNNSNIYSTSGVALDTGTGWTAGDTITIDNNALIVGHGGDGGAGGGGVNTVQAGAAGGAGSTAFNLQFDVTINNTGGTISGGSGGGGGGGSARITGTNKSGSFSAIAGGGGGGAGRASASGGALGNVTGTGAQVAQDDGTAGNASTITNRGTGGAAGSASFSGSTATGGAGGNGGANTASAGVNGATAVAGSQLGAGGTGGAGGKAINLNGNSITYTATGTIYGAVS